MCWPPCPWLQVVSSQAQRLRPLAIALRCKPDTVRWFLDDISDIRPARFLEDAASELVVQGLKLAWTGIVWDGDLRWKNSGCMNYSCTGSTWQNIRSPDRQVCQINACRVLVNRARQRMILSIPPGNLDDLTRKPEFYDRTCQELKGIGMLES